MLAKHKIEIIMRLYVIQVFIMALIACSSPSESINSYYNNDLEELRYIVINDTSNYDALKTYAILLVRDKQHKMAEKYLEKTLKKFPSDSELLFNYGLNYEFLNNKYSALQVYSNYPIISPTSSYYELMRGRFLYLSREIANEEIAVIVSREETLNMQNISSNSLAIFPLTYMGSDEKYSPLSTGFSEMISIDLGKIIDLTVLERIRLQAVINELKLSNSNLVDKSTAPRMGKLLSAAKVYNGVYNVNEDREFFLEMDSWDVLEHERGEVIKKEVDLSDLFIIEKEIVFDIIDQLGIVLTPVEREEIEFIPTQNIDAFLAYSKGLELENEGNFSEAVSYYQQAYELDPNFNDASNKMGESQSLKTSSISKESLSNLTKEITDLGPDTESLIDSRLDILSKDIRGNFTDDIDSRKPTQDYVISILEIPLPPPRPAKP